MTRPSPRQPIRSFWITMLSVITWPQVTVPGPPVGGAGGVEVRDKRPFKPYCVLLREDSEAFGLHGALGVLDGVAGALLVGCLGLFLFCVLFIFAMIRRYVGR